MHSRHAIPDTISRLAAEQAGVLSRTQVLGLGLNRRVVGRLLAEERWSRLAPGIYLAEGTAAPWLARVWAGLLLGGPDARAGGRTAATLHGLTETEDLPIQILVPFGVLKADRSWVSFAQERPGVRQPSLRAQPPRTRIEDTVLDLCGVGTESECIAWITAAVQRRLTNPLALSRALERRSRLRHRSVVQDVLTDVSSGVHSRLEHRYLHDVERAHHLPVALRQFRIPGTASFADVAYADYGVLVELDGRIGHVEEGMWRDRRRDNRHSGTNLMTLRFGWREVTDNPCGIALDVADSLVRRGWSGMPTRCHRCPP